MSNLDLYNKLKLVPQEAKKPIPGGRLKGMTDINPMWRIKTMTEQFGPCGIGWYYTIDKQWIEKGDGVEQKAFCNITLYFKHNGEWSIGIPGTGGSDFVTQETKGVFTSDEAFKMALTDALSVSMKAIGVAADVYFEKDRTKYDKPDQPETPTDKVTTQQLIDMAKSKNITEKGLINRYKADTGKEVTEVKFIPANVKLRYYNAMKEMTSNEKV